MASNICPVKFSSLAERKSRNSIYHEIFKWKMQQAPKNINRFCDSSLNEKERKELVRWLRYRNLKGGTNEMGVGQRNDMQKLDVPISWSPRSEEIISLFKNFFLGIWKTKPQANISKLCSLFPYQVPRILRKFAA